MRYVVLSFGEIKTHYSLLLSLLLLSLLLLLLLLTTYEIKAMLLLFLWSLLGI